MLSPCPDCYSLTVVHVDPHQSVLNVLTILTTLNPHHSTIFHFELPISVPKDLDVVTQSLRLTWSGMEAALFLDGSENWLDEWVTPRTVDNFHLSIC